MTREEKIEQLENTILLIKQNGKDWWDERDIPILEEAIKSMKMEPCEDYISRQAVLDLPRRTLHSYWGKPVGDVLFIDDIKALPPVHVQMKNVLDKIRAEIIDTGAYEQETMGQIEFLRGINYCLSIIDKYMAGSEDKE